MVQVVVQPTLLDAHTRMLQECSLFSSHATGFVQQAKDYCSTAVPGFLGELDNFITSTGQPSIYRDAPGPGPLAPAVTSRTRAPVTHVEAAPIDIPPGCEDLFRHHTQRQTIAEAKDAVESGLGARLVRPFELWLELYGSAKEALPKVEKLRRAYDAQRIRLEAAKMEVQAEEAHSPLTMAPGTAPGYAPESLGDAASAAGAATRAPAEAAMGAPAPRVMAQEEAGGLLAPVPAAEARQAMYAREGAVTDAELTFSEEEERLRHALSWLVSTAERLKGYAAHGMTHGLRIAGERELPMELLPEFPEHLLPRAQQRSLDEAVRNEHTRLRRTAAAYRDAMAREAAAEALAAGAGMLAAAAPEEEVARLVSAAAAEAAATSPPAAAGAAAAAAAAAPGEQLPTSRPAVEPPRSAGGAPPAPAPAGAAAAAGMVSQARAAAGPGHAAVTENLNRAELELLALAVAGGADAAKQQAGGRREAIAKRLVREAAAYLHAGDAALQPAIEQHLGSVLAERARARRDPASAAVAALAAADARNRTFDVAALRAIDELDMSIQEDEDLLGLLAQAPGVTPEEGRRLAASYVAARAAAPARPPRAAVERGAGAAGAGPLGPVAAVAGRVSEALGLAS